MNPGVLSDLFETAPGANLRMNQLVGAFGVDALAPPGDDWVIELPLSEDALCIACGDPHNVDVSWDEVRQEHGGYCADGGGWFAVATEARRRFCFRHERLLQALSQAFSLKVKPEQLVQGACWLLGATKVRDVEIDMVVAREMNDPRGVMAMAGALKRKRTSWKGMILTGAPPMVDIGALPRGLKMVELKEIIAFDGAGEIAIDLHWVAVRLGLAGPGRGGHGAPRTHPQLVPYIEERLASGRALASDSAEARHVLADPTWATLGASTPAFHAVRMIVGRLRKGLG